MKLLWCCFLAAITIAQGGVDVEKTVRQVEVILHQNTQLPRLTREEIIQLLNDIRSEDAKSSSSYEKSKEIKTTTTTDKNLSKEVVDKYESFNDSFNEISKDVKETNYFNRQTQEFPTSTVNYEKVVTSKEPNIMVVLPYTSRDGSSLQDLYSKPPRVEVVPASHVAPEGSKKPTIEKIQLDSNNKIKEMFTNNAKSANKVQKQAVPPELQEFLDMHGLTGNPGDDHFLLPLEGFKPLPTPKTVDESVELPEKILLTYDLIPTETKQNNKDSIPPRNVLYEPLQPEFPFELETSPSYFEKSVLPLDLPKKRTTKSTSSIPQPNYEPIDYDSIKVIPLQKGPKPEDNEEKVSLENEQNKRQVENVSTVSESTSTTPTSITPPEEAKNTSSSNSLDTKDASSSISLDASPSDTGASITDLEDSFGGAVPSEPGDSMLPPPRKNGFYWMLDWNSFLEVGDGDTKVNIRIEPKLGDPQMFLSVNVP